jgi:predicted DCC family thiol-disulfide oxidoreductase YuxK
MRDRKGDAFRFAPLDSSTFRRLVPEGERTGLPDSIVVRRADGRLLVRSAAVLYVLVRLGGFWRLLAGLIALIPAAVRDRAYDVIARKRHRLFAKPAESCPLLPDAMKKRFDS